MKIKSSQIIYSEHDYDECFEYTDGSGRVPEGNAVGIVSEDGKSLTLFSDVKYSKYDHNYWDNHELEHDIDRIILP
jgi:hypothetical protein|tara:strand:+ start:39537 stop:39764 length:228 start_codon:yes stop_codon:yes gene_type:complete